MSDMLKSFVGQELERNLREEYPHLRYPPAMYAQIVNSRNEAGYYSYVIRILDKNKREDVRFPEIPKVLSEMPYKVGDIIVIVFLYGDIVPYIMGRAV